MIDEEALKIKNFLYYIVDTEISKILHFPMKYKLTNVCQYYPN